MTPCTSYFDFDPELACMMAAGFEPFTALPLTRYDLIKDIRAMANVRSEEVRPAVGEDDLAAGPPWPGATAFLPHSERARFTRPEGAPTSFLGPLSAAFCPKIDDPAKLTR